MSTPKKLDIEELKTHLQTAIDVELSTIPIYLYTYYSINRVPEYPKLKQSKAQKIATFANKAGGIIMSVAVEEMLHLSLVSNILKSLGGSPKIYGQSPGHYPTNLLHHKKGFSIGLTKFTKKQLEKFMDVEKPAPMAPAPQADNWETLGQFYEYVSSLIEQTSPSDYAKKDKAHTNQLVEGKGYYASSNIDTVYPKDAFYIQKPANPHDPSARGADQAQYPNSDDSGGLRHILGKKDALAAIHEIAEQGEGQRKDPKHQYDDKDKAEDSHWFKYNELHKEFSSMKLTNKELAGFVHNFPDSPDICSMPRGMQFMVDLNNAVYSYLLWMTELSFTLYGSAQSSMFYIGMHKGMIFILDKLIGGMRYLSYKDKKGNKYNLAPTFDNYEFSSIETAKQELVALCELVASKPDLKLDANILERIKDLPDVNVVNNVVSFA